MIRDGILHGSEPVYTRYHHGGKRRYTDESVTERASALVRSPLGRGRDFALAGHLVQLETVDGLAARRLIGTDLAEITHARYGILSADQWRAIIGPMLNAQVDKLDLNGPSKSLRPMVERSLYTLLDSIKTQMTSPNAKASGKPVAAGREATHSAVNRTVVMLKIWRVIPPALMYKMREKYFRFVRRKDWKRRFLALWEF